MKYFLSLYLTAMLALVGCSEQRSQIRDNSPAELASYLPGEIIVQGEEGQIKHALDELAPHYQISLISPSSKIFQVKYRNSKLTALKLSVELSKRSGIDFAEPNFILQADAMGPPKDPFFNLQWALSNLGQDAPRGASGEAGADLGALKAWEITKGDSSIVVGVVDTGIDYQHPDLQENIWINEKEKRGIPGKDDDGNGFTDDLYGWDFVSQGREKPFYGQLGDNDPMDDHSHGTHCAGIVGALPGNLQGVAGLNWQVKLMALKFMGKMGNGSTLDAYRAIVYGVDNGAHILSNSWGGGPATKTMAQAVKYALDKGVLFVAAAGNDGLNTDLTPQFPAAYPFANVVAVAASNNKDRPASFTNYGVQSAHIAAPGVDILSTIPRSMASADSRAYASYSGTSMATPYVAAAAALVLAHEESLRRKPLELKARLLDTVDRLPAFTHRVSSGGRLNVYRALKNERNEVATDRPIENQVVSFLSPTYNQEKFDVIWKIHQSEAKRVRVNFDYAMVDIGFDLLAVYDKNFQLVSKFEAESPVQVYSPWIEGDTVYVRYANALVQMQKEEEKIFDKFEDALAAGARICQGQQGSTQLKCYIYTLSTPYPNFDSQGVKISSFDFQR